MITFGNSKKISEDYTQSDNSNSCKGERNMLSTLSSSNNPNQSDNSNETKVSISK